MMVTASNDLTRRIKILRILLPVGFAAVAIFYQFSVANWVHDQYGEDVHYFAEILFFATVGPLLAYWVLTLIGRWLDEKRFAEEQARQSERRLASITSASADAIFSIDSDGQIDSWNRGAKILIGYEKDEVIGQPLSDLIVSRSGSNIEVDWLFSEVLRLGYIRGHEITVHNSEGQSKVVEITATRLMNQAGDHEGVSIIMRDITQRKQREEEISRLNENLNQQVTERTQELGLKVKELALANNELQKLDRTRTEFVSLVTHQIRAPLTNMQGAVGRMNADCGAVNGTCAKMFSILRQQFVRMDRLVEDVLNTARIEAGEIVVQTEPVSLVPLITQVVEQTRARMTHRRIVIPHKPGMPYVLADRDLFSEAFANLLDNADKYSPEQSDISIDVHANQTEVIISVHDSGPGLQDEDLESVFNKFYRSDSSDSQLAYGYGLGLYVSRQLIEVQGGQIWVKNHPEGGAEFSISLPVWNGSND
ncbi:MAG: ATP-binding protein [Anaerolineales bacterium]